MDALRFLVAIFGNPIGAIVLGVLLWAFDRLIGLPVFVSLLIAGICGVLVAAFLKWRSQ